MLVTPIPIIPFGEHYFKAAVILRQSFFIGGILFNTEAWYGLNENEMQEFEMIDNILLRKIFKSHSKVAKEALYLELGVLPMRFIIMARRVNFLYYILKLDKKELLSKFYHSQKLNPSKNDWTTRVKRDMEILSINLTDEQIASVSKFKFKKMIKEKARQAAFEYLMDIKKSHSKMDNLQYSQLEMQKYLSNNFIYKNDAQLLFKLRTRMADFKGNFKNGNVDLTCRFCLEDDLQDHVLVCDAVASNIPEASQVQYKNLFSSNEKEVKRTLEAIKKALQYRENNS